MTLEPEINVYRPDRPGIRKVLGDLEAEIMELVWARAGDEGVTVRTVFETLYERRRLAYTTVMSTMARLARKNLLRAEKREQAFIYFPNFTRQEFISRFASRILEDVLVGFAGAAAEGEGTLNDERAASRLQQLLAEISQRRAAEEGR